MEGYNEEYMVGKAFSIEAFSGLEPHLFSIAMYLTGFSFDHLEDEEWRKTRRNAKGFVVWNGKVFRRVLCDVTLVPNRKNRSSFLKAYHEDIRP